MYYLSTVNFNRISEGEIKVNRISQQAAQWAYDNACPPDDADDEFGYEECEYHKTQLVERFVTYANAAEFQDSDTFVESLTGFPEGHWANEFVAQELADLIDEYYPSDDQIEAAAERSAKYALNK
jgi:hypothetical protein